MTKNESPFETLTDVGKMTQQSMEQVPTDVRKMTEQSMDQVRTAIDSQMQFLKRAVPGNVMGGNELSRKVLNYAERNVHNAFVFAHKFVQVKDVQDLVKLQTEFIQSQMQAMTEQVKDLSETATKTVMDAVKGVGGPRGESGLSS
jgi:phasin family protein